MNLVKEKENIDVPVEFVFVSTANDFVQNTYNHVGKRLVKDSSEEQDDHSG